MSKELTPLDYFIALGQTCLMQSRNYKNNEVVVLKNGEKHTTQELGGIVVDALKALEVIIKKRVNIAYFYQFISEHMDASYEQYLELRKINGIVFAISQKEILTEEEFETVKEALL